MRNGKQDGKGETSMKDDVSGIGKRKNGIHSRAEGGEAEIKRLPGGWLRSDAIMTICIPKFLSLNRRDRIKTTSLTSEEVF